MASQPRPGPALVTPRPRGRGAAVALAASLVLAACGGEAPARTPTCSVSITGAASLTTPCTAVASWTARTGTASVQLILPSSTTPNVNAFAAWVGSMRTGTYRNTDANAATTIGVDDPASGRAWLAAGAAAPVGTSTLVVTGLGAAISGTSGLVYAVVHGTLDATLDPVAASGASGTVTLHAAF